MRPTESTYRDDSAFKHFRIARVPGSPVKRQTVPRIQSRRYATDYQRLTGKLDGSDISSTQGSTMASGDDQTEMREWAGGAERRRHERAGTDQLIVVKTSTGEVVGELLDISASGARLRIREGLCPSVDEPVSILLLDGTELSGTISRVDETSIGFAFDIRLLQPDDYLHHDHLGFDFYRALRSLQSKLAGAN